MIDFQNYITFDDDSLFKSNKLYETNGLLTKSTNFNQPISEFKSKDINISEDYLNEFIPIHHQDFLNTLEEFYLFKNNIKSIF